MTTALPLGAAGASATSVPTNTLTFRLRVTGAHDPAMTFWVAYGPLGGTFGLIRLQPSGHEYYTATRSLPAGRTVFSYIAGTGTVQTRLGPAPGYPTITIARMGPGAPVRSRTIALTWHAPVG
jgi:hypothetical protein